MLSSTCYHIGFSSAHVRAERYIDCDEKMCMHVLMIVCMFCIDQRKFRSKTDQNCEHARRSTRRACSTIGLSHDCISNQKWLCCSHEPLKWIIRITPTAQYGHPHVVGLLIQHTIIDLPPLAPEPRRVSLLDCVALESMCSPPVLLLASTRAVATELAITTLLELLDELHLIITMHNRMSQMLACAFASNQYASRLMLRT